MKTKLFFISCLSFFALFGCSQKYGIHKSHAFTRIFTAGNIPVDEQNQPLTSGVQRNYIIYIETPDNTNLPVWDTAWVGSKTYLIKPLKIEQEQVRLGKIKDSQSEVIVQPQQGYTLWQLMLTPLQNSKPDKSDTDAIIHQNILLSGIWKEKKVNYTIKNVTELETIFGQ